MNGSINHSCQKPHNIVLIIATYTQPRILAFHYFVEQNLCANATQNNSETQPTKRFLKTWKFVNVYQFKHLYSPLIRIMFLCSQWRRCALASSDGMFSYFYRKYSPKGRLRNVQFKLQRALRYAVEVRMELRKSIASKIQHILSRRNSFSLQLYIVIIGAESNRSN